MDMEARIIALGHATSQLATTTTAKHRVEKGGGDTLNPNMHGIERENSLVLESTCGHWARKNKEDRLGQEMRSLLH